MKGKKLAAALFAALNLLLFTGAYAVSVPIEVEFGQTEARTMLGMINAFRAGTRKDYPMGTAVSGFPWQRTEAGGIEVLEPRAVLVYDAKLEWAAMQRAAEIAVYYDHVLPDGTNLRDCHYFDDYSVYGENIAAGQESAEEVFTAWMETNDPYEKQGHRRNMLKEHFTAVGFGHVVYNGRHYWVQEFGSPASGETVPVPNDTKQAVIVDADLDFMGVTYPESGQTAYILNGGTLDLKTVVCVTRPITPGSENLQNMALPASYVSQDEDVVTVDGDGVARAVGDGEAVVRVTADNGAYDVTVTLIVYTDFTSVEFGMTEQRWTYSTGETTKFFPVFTPEGSYGETWFESKDTEVATVDNEGNAEFLKEGTVEIYLRYRHVGTSEEVATGYPFTVVAPEQQSIVRAVVTPERSSYVYTGNPITPAVTVTLDGTALTADDYDVAYADNTNAGTATITVTGKGNYKDTATGSFTITAKPITDADVSVVTGQDLTYIGSAITPTITVTLNGTALTADDYDVAYADNTNAGTATITVTGKGNYKDTATESFTITAKPITGAAVSVVTGQDLTYTGSAITPAITVTLDGALTADDYDVEYADNTNAGTATITVTGKGNYKDMATGSFTITAKSLADAYVTTPKILVKGWTRQQGIDIEKVLDDSHARGGIYADDYAANSGETEREGYAACTPLKCGWTEPFHSGSSKVLMMTAPIYYHGNALKPEVWVRFGKEFDEATQDGEGKYSINLDGLLTPGIDYNVEYEDNENAGEATFRVIGKGNYTGEKNGTFTIAPASFNMGTGVFAKKETLTAGQEHDAQFASVMNSLVVAVAEDVTLRPGDDYEVEVDGSGELIKFEEGQFRISLRGKGNYAASSPDTAYWSCGLLQPQFPNGLPAQGAKLPQALVTIGDNAFAGTALNALDLTDTEIANLTEGAFAGNEKLEIVFLPATVAAVAKLEALNIRPGVWLVFDGKPVISRQNLDTLSYDLGIFYRIPEAGE